ncbi:hypothetical protein HPP92_020875 [Vanilla planifolia]|uniref:Uncharacterized protein n=1 Tax=Vanilla planifolia TaxID=51239 RepID=A0A835UGN2_VANPL|nr:hypothetical protein HPP92_020875 [Vanilla planifolia]
MVPVAISGKLHGSSVCTLNPEVIVNLGRKRVKNYSYGHPTVAFMGMLVLGFACCELSEELPLVSVPLGFRIFGYDKGTTWISQNGFSWALEVESSGKALAVLQILYFQSLQASSLNSIASYYSFEIRRSGEIALVWENNVTYWSSHLSHPVVVEVRLEEDGLLRLFDANGVLLGSVTVKIIEIHLCLSDA